MTPAPITTSFFGTAGRNRAPVEDTTVVSSIVTPGRLATSEPGAITIAFASTVSVEPSSFATVTWPGAAIVALP